MKKINIQKLNYAMIHSQVGFPDGVSIVMQQIESVMTKNLGIPKSNIYYLVGKSKNPSPYIKQNKHFWHKSKTNILVNKQYNLGFGGAVSEKIEKAINEAKEAFKIFIEKKKIDVIIAHNTSHPVNFIYSIAISRYYRDQIKKGLKTPKYILWWHDSHLERERYNNPPRDVKNYLLEGVPGKYIDYIAFINKLQFKSAQKYFQEIDSRYKGFYNKLLENKTIIYNTASTPINSINELKKKDNEIRTKLFLKDFKIEEILEKNKLKFNETLFVLQHTRVVQRKRIDFALEYAYELLSNLDKKGIKKAIIFFISGQSGDERGNYKRKLIELNKKLSKKYNTNKFFLIFKENHKTTITFEETPLIFSKLGGIATYFSEIEGFGNNLLEVLAGGLVPIVYTYPVFRSDISKYKFNVIALKEFKISQESINKTIDIIQKEEERLEYGNKNIEILRKKLSHQTIAPKLKRAITKERNILK
jgi:mannosylglucosylglycerate synthase